MKIKRISIELSEEAEVDFAKSYEFYFEVSGQCKRKFKSTLSSKINKICNQK